MSTIRAAEFPKSNPRSSCGIAGGMISSKDMSSGARRFFLGELRSDSESYTGGSVSDSISQSSCKVEEEDAARAIGLAYRAVV